MSPNKKSVIFPFNSFSRPILVRIFSFIFLPILELQLFFQGYSIIHKPVQRFKGFITGVQEKDHRTLFLKNANMALVHNTYLLFGLCEKFIGYATSREVRFGTTFKSKF